MRVLYIDDDRVNSLLFVEVCRLAPGVTVQSAGTAEEAMEMVRGFAPELLVIDLHLPDGNGFELLPRLRGRVGRELPAYLCSADHPAQVEAEARAAGFAECWSKPLDIPQVLSALRRHADDAGAVPPAQ